MVDKMRWDKTRGCFITETSSVPAHVSGFLELPMAQVTLEAQDVDMQMAGAEKKLSTVSLDAPEDAPAGAIP